MICRIPLHFPSGEIREIHVVDRSTTIQNLIGLISHNLSIPESSISIFEGKTKLHPLAKAHLLVIDSETGLSPVLEVRFAAVPSRSASDSLDLTRIDPRQQAAIYAQIRRDRVQENLRQAPSIRLGRNIRCVVCKVQGKTLRMIVDTGASLSVLYMNQVELCSVAYLIDRRCQVVLMGIADAQSRAVGVIHALEIDVGGAKTRGSFAVLEGSNVNGILGIDWLSQNGAMIDTAGDSMVLKGKKVKFVDP
jgi:hypothetical protein